MIYIVSLALGMGPPIAGGDSNKNWPNVLGLDILDV